METKGRAEFFLVIFLFNVSVFNALPVLSTSADETETSTLNNEDFNSTEELYVIRAVVYEVGILTDEDNSTDESEESHEAVELTFFDPDRNGSVFNLSNIPLPVQTNISGHVITGLAPVNLGSLQLPADVTGSDPVFQPPEDGAATFPLHSALVSVTTNLSTRNEAAGSEILQGLPALDLFNVFSKANDSDV